MSESKEKKVEKKEKTFDKKAFANRKLKLINQMPNRAKAEALARRVLRNSKEGE